jgi:hypothetical protein
MKTTAQHAANVSEIQGFCEYEIAASLWAKHLSLPWAQRLAGKYFAWKTRRKYARYQWHKHLRIELRGSQS